MTDDDDEQLLARLGRIAGEIEPVPAELMVGARAVFGLRALEAELAALVADSYESAHAVRGPTTVRLLSYEVAGVTIELEVTPDGPLRRLLGEVTGARGPVQLDTMGATTTVEVDELGRFVVADVPAGPIRLRCTGDSGETVATSWTTV